MSDKIQETFASTAKTDGPNYSHPNSAEIIRDAIALLETIPTGKKLLPLIKAKDISIRAIVGKEPGLMNPDDKTIILTVPKSLIGVNPFEISCNLGLGLREIELNFVDFQNVSVPMTVLQNKMIDIILEMCKMVSEFHDVHNHVKLVDLIDKIGHGKVYKLYKDGAEYKELADLIAKELNFKEA